jgi:hypothetical protein
MADLFTPQYWPLWALALALALFIPVRQLIWVIYVRRAQRLGGGDEPDRARLKKRAGFSAALICLVFSYIYVRYLFLGAS